MNIDKIGQIGKIGKIEKGGLIKGKEGVINEADDTLSISSEGKKASELDSLKKLVFNVISSIPDVRSERIDTAEGRIKEGYYNRHIQDIASSLLSPSV
ncbi:MAG: flagellar biosynthesis anti-sigma factor FlgM [bacterium]